MFDASLGAASAGQVGRVALSAGDEVIKATLRIAKNGASQSLGVTINGVDRTSALGGGWATVPVELDITGYAAPIGTSDANITVNVVNNGGSPTEVQAQFFVEVLR
jgi:hypothetical protein